VLKITGFSGENLDHVAIKDFFLQYGNVGYVDCNNPSKVRMTGS